MNRWVILFALGLGCACSAPPPVASTSALAPAPAASAMLEPADPPAMSAPELVDAVAEPQAATTAYGCTLQPPQTFLMRETYTSISSQPNPERQAAHRHAIAYRTRAYGHVEGFGDASLNPIPPKDYQFDGSFFGIPIRMNNRVLSALQCVEAAIEAECSDAYRPVVADGFRTQNKFHNNEISNHAYGIAIDLDFHLNPCCGCIAAISDRPLCKEPATAYERTVIPRCWIETFERFGFYWLGHDALEDTMHFEFLGDPDRILAGS